MIIPGCNSGKNLTFFKKKIATPFRNCEFLPAGSQAGQAGECGSEATSSCSSIKNCFFSPPAFCSMTSLYLKMLVGNNTATRTLICQSGP